jgi:peptide/nickel transport system permease protein
MENLQRVAHTKASRPPAVAAWEQLEQSRLPLSLMKLLRRSAMSVIGGLLVLCIIGVAILAPAIALHDPIANDLSQRLQSPSHEYLFGTDEYGRDVFSRVVWGTRISLLVACIVVSIAVIGGVTVGIVAGYLQGMIDTMVMRVIDIMLAFPALLLALAVMASLGSNLTNVMIAIAVAFLPRFARLQRAVVLSIRESEYIQAARAAGASHRRVILQHLLPNCVAPIIVMATVSAADAILVEASLSFLGLGVQPPTPTWGGVISDGREFLRNAPWVSTFSGAAIMMTVLGFNLMGDGLRDLLDPRLRGEEVRRPSA